MIRTSKQTAVRYVRRRCLHLADADPCCHVKKIGRIPNGGGWKAWGRPDRQDLCQQRSARIGYDYIHSAVDDHTRLAYSETPQRRTRRNRGRVPDAVPPSSSHRAASPGIEAVMTDNHWSYTKSQAFADARSTRSRPITSPSAPTVPGRTARSNDSTAPSKPNGPTNRSSSATTNAPTPCHHGSSTTTTNDQSLLPRTSRPTHHPE